MKINEKIKKLIIEKKLTQAELADRIGFSQVYLSDILRGKKGRNMQIQNVQKFADALGVPVSYLLEDNSASQTGGDNSVMISGKGNVTYAHSTVGGGSSGNAKIDRVAALLKYAPEPMLDDLEQTLTKLKEISSRFSG